MKSLMENGFFPVIIAVALFLTYALCDKSFVQCEWFGLCDGINSGVISQVTDTDDKKLKEVPGVLEKKRGELKTINDQINTKNGEIAAKQTEVEDKEREIANTEDAELKKPLLKEKTALEKQKAALTAEAAKLTKEKEAISGEILGISKLVSERYAKRMSWVFLTGCFFLLCVAAIVVSSSAIVDSLARGEGLIWLIITAVIAFVFALAVFLNKEEYMSIVLPFFSKSIGQYGDVSIQAINFFNVLGFAATIFLVSASSAVMTGILKTKEENSKVPPPEPLKTYEKYHSHIKTVLYVGAFMLFVGMLRMQLLADWHLAFVSMDAKNEYYILLKSFSTSSIAVQAGFYTILLAVIYLPVAYSIPEKEKDENETPGFFEKLGLPIGGDFLPRLISILLPFLAGPFIKLFEFFAAKGS